MNVLIVWLLLCVVWGTTWIFIKLGLEDLPPLTFASARFVVACSILYIVLRIKKITLPPSPETGKLILITGFMQFCLNYGLLFWGEQYISSGLAAVLQAIIPAFGLVLARIYVGEKITKLKIASILAGIAGVAIIFKDQLELNGENAFWGSLAVVAGAFAAAYSSVLVKAKGMSIDPASLIFGQMTIGLIILSMTAFFAEGNPLNFNWSLKAIICVFYLAILGSIVAFWLYYWLLSKTEVSNAMMISLVTPLIAVVVGSLVLDEKLDRNTLWGGILIMFSVGLIVIKPLLNRRKNAEVL